jgi:drug/metabolite transporter (DMT)-like permease
MSKRSPIPYLVLLAGVCVAASASIMTRLLQQPSIGMPSTVIAAGRLGMAALILLPIAWLRVGAEIRSLSRHDIAWGVASGVLLALHFDTWIASFEYTSVASSVALVTTNPLWVTLFSFLLWREKPLPLTMLGMVLAVAGSICIGLSDSSGDAPTNALFGDALALLGALTVSGYFLIGRMLRRRMSLLAYIWLVYTSDLRLAQLPNFPPLAYALVLALALGPQLLGHSAFNWVLRYVSPTLVAIALLGEPIGASLLAWWFFDETFKALQLIGFVLLLIGIGAASVGESQATPRQSPPD